ncbi:phosphoribosylanthranilate isomerase [Candidatus Woesearchaeota archaeon]|nr:phosphoribosylanthranilate isomerase [Candidatus Woesearchaeota archaeon]
MLIKICGVSNEIDAMAAIKAGATAIGFVMGGKVLPVEVEPHAQTIREIIKKFPENVDSFIVTHLTEVDDIVALANYVNSTGIQVSEDVGFEKLGLLRTKTNKKIIKTVVVDPKTGTDKLSGYQPCCDYILLDTCHGGYTGGTGVTNDWELCNKLISLSKKPVYIAGGLTPENLADAMKKTKPQGVDVSTGVSTYSPSYLRKDRKDESKIKSFIKIAKGFENEKK